MKTEGEGVHVLSHETSKAGCFDIGLYLDTANILCIIYSVNAVDQELLKGIISCV